MGFAPPDSRRIEQAMLKCGCTCQVITEISQPLKIATYASYTRAQPWREEGECRGDNCGWRKGSADVKAGYRNEG